MRLPDWQLRFWQASEDHRGTPESPGRVVTIIPQAGAQVWGRIYRMDGCRETTLAYLDHREKGGYERNFFQVETSDGDAFEALSYVGALTNRNYIGPEEEEATAAVIKQAVGPSGRNVEYLEKLYLALKEMERMEPHVERLYRLVNRSS